MNTLSAKSYCADNPSVSFADSSLYTREPFQNQYILQKLTCEQIAGQFNCFMITAISRRDLFQQQQMRQPHMGPKHILAAHRVRISLSGEMPRW